MKQFAIIGVGNFGIRMLDELSENECEILILDKDRELVEKLKDRVTAAYMADVMDEETITKLIPPTIDAAIVDLGGRVEVSTLVTHYLHKMGVKKIIVKAETDEHGEILSIVGATQVIFPSREAAKRVAPLLTSPLMFSFLPIGSGLVIAEVRVPERYYGMTLVEADLRRTTGMNVIAIRKALGGEYAFFSQEYRLQPDDVFLLAGSEESVTNFAGNKFIIQKKGLTRIIKDFFKRGS